MATNPFNTQDAEPRFPDGLQNAFIFAIFNALSFQIVLGSPMVLYAKTLGASATVLGIITGMMPLLVIFQIPAARHIASTLLAISLVPSAACCGKARNEARLFLGLV